MHASVLIYCCGYQDEVEDVVGVVVMVLLLLLLATHAPDPASFLYVLELLAGKRVTEG